MEMEDQHNTPATDTARSSWEKDLIERLAIGPLKEQRRARRWKIFFTSLFFVYLTVIIIQLIPDSDVSAKEKHTALVEISGVIASDRDANADTVVTGLRAAFKNKKSVAVILRINSPGGSPVQAGYVADEIIRLRANYPDKKLYAVISDVCASGGYYIAAVADEIYADKASIVGSIGVLMNSFGFVGSMEKLGVERRLLTAGKNKGFLDPFSPLKESDKQHIETMLGNIHQQFKDVVKKGRGDRIADNEELFSGLVWTGEQGVKIGLVDKLGSASYVAREVVGQEDIVDYTRHPDFFERFAGKIGASMANVLATRLGLGVGLDSAVIQ